MMSKYFEQLEDRRLLCGAHFEFTGAPPASPVPATATINAPAVTPPASPSYALSAVPVLNSLPNAYAQLVLDFNGDTAGYWNFGGDTYYVPATPAYSIDGDRNSFTDEELTSIRDIWTRVAEKYSPFNINVTTVDPGMLDDNHVLKVVIGGDGSWFGQDAGGVGTYGGFAGPPSNKVFVFSDKSGGDQAVVGEAAAHEAGHGFGVEHQSVYDADGAKVDEYNPGNSLVSPIMGFNPASQRKMWWVGRNALGITQNDADVIASTRNGFGYRTDDYGIKSTLPADGAKLSGTGVLERVGDSDGFLFTVNGAESIGARVIVSTRGPMLDAKFEVRTNLDSGYKVLATANTANLGETLSGLKLAAGTYRLVVSTNNTPNTPNGYGLGLGSYGVTILSAKTSAATYAVETGGTATLSANGPASLGYAWDLDGDGKYGETGADAKQGNETGRTVTFKSATLAAGAKVTVKVRVSDGSISSVAVATVNVTSTNPPVPAQWTSRDVGNVGAAGSATAPGGSNSFVVKGAGADVQGTADAFYFVSQPMSGNGQIVARVDSINATNGWAKAGLMIRTGDGANAKNAFLFVTPSNGVKLTTRTTTGGTTATSSAYAASAPQWLKLVRDGNNISGYASADGSTWQLVATRTVDLGASALVGLAFTSHEAGKLGTGTFSNVAITTPPATGITRTLAPTHDGYVRGGSSAATNFGSATDLIVKNSTAAYAREAYVKFDLSTVSTIGKAVLRLYGKTDAGNIRISAIGTSIMWNEATLTYDNRPATTGSTLATTTVTATAGWYEWDVTAYLQTRKDAGDALVSIALRGTDVTEALTKFSSSEAAGNGPQLVVT